METIRKILIEEMVFYCVVASINFDKPKRLQNDCLLQQRGEEGRSVTSAKVEKKYEQLGFLKARSESLVDVDCWSCEVRFLGMLMEKANSEWEGRRRQGGKMEEGRVWVCRWRE
ncbi:unnamed protein product [Ilex paraguariensis]|uniref:Uncharacterized protein n=1 Tax=Ilex paraguariensis TaxID=185542 RepID=A0ABC8SY54_9AQUA